MRDVSNDAYSVARKNKDGKFDGNFFFAVSTTGIVCRPSCPSPIAKEENVMCFSSLYDAMNLINEGFLNSNSVSDLADYFHLPERYFRKLFVSNIGIAPTQIAKYNRAIFAKRMLMNSDLPVTKVAFASGFGSIRQFNNVFKDIFKVSPSDIRKEKRDDSKTGRTMLLPYKKPFDFSEVLEFMQARMMKGLGKVDAFPAGDLWVINALKKEFGKMKIRDIKKLSDKLRPYRAYVTLYLWQSLLEV